MKKIVASVGLVALGASSIGSASAQVLNAPDNSKPWSVAATLRGFYDDNTATIPNSTPNAALGGYKRGSFGWEVSPSAALAWSVEQTTLNLGLLYSLKYYQDRPPFTGSHSDQTFTFNAGLDHSFSERYKARVNDSFVIGQEPDLLRAGNTFSTFQYVSGDNIRNFGSIAFDGQLTPDFGMGFGYDNSYYDYQNRGFSVDPGTGAVVPSLAGILNRIENRAHIEGLYQILPETKGLIGYQFTDVDYTAAEPIAGQVIFGTFLIPTAMSDTRNYRQHSGYIGAEHNFSPDFTGSIRGGASYTEYYNAPGADKPVTPYVNATLKYTYAPQSYVEGGFSYDRSPTDVIANSGIVASGSSLTLDAESAVAFASVNHRITPNIFGSLIGQFQDNTYHGGAADGKTEQFYLIGVNMEYRFNQYLSAHAGYNYDNLGSELGRHFDRNRIYFGVTASY